MTTPPPSFNALVYQKCPDCHGIKGPKYCSTCHDSGTILTQFGSELETFIQGEIYGLCDVKDED